MTRTYHGTTISALAGGRQLRSGKREYAASLAAFVAGTFTAGLYVTESVSLAARYANMKATGAANREATTPGEHTVILEIETSNGVRWWRRSDDDVSFNLCEAVVDSGTVRIAEMHECSYAYCTCHADAETIRAAFEMNRQRPAGVRGPTAE